MSAPSLGTSVPTLEIPVHPLTRGTPGPMLVFLHGRGLGPESAFEVRGAFATAHVLAPWGGVALGQGHTWFLNERIGVAKPESVAEAEARFLAWCDGPPICGAPVWLSGFSNGGAFLPALLINHPDQFLGAALFSAPLVLPPWPGGALAMKPVFYGRGGERDRVVPQAMFEAAEAYLAGPSGSLATLHCYDIGHEIAAEEIGDVGLWFRAVSTPLLQRSGRVR